MLQIGLTTHLVCVYEWRGVRRDVTSREAYLVFLCGTVSGDMVQGACGALVIPAAAPPALAPAQSLSAPPLALLPYVQNAVDPRLVLGRAL